MCKQLKWAAMAGFLLVPQVSWAQMMPFFDINKMAQNELAFQQQFNHMAWQQSLALAKLYGNRPIPYNAMTIFKANNDAQNYFHNHYLPAVQQNSKVASEAVSNWTKHAIQGIGPYYNPQTGHIYESPWIHNQYHLNRYGEAAPGYNPYRTNLYPYYGR